MRDIFPYIADIIPEGEVGSAKIEHFTVSESESQYTKMRAAIKGDASIGVPEDRYAKLLINGDLMMSDTPMEMSEYYRPVRRAQGDVLIGGLGFGLILVPIMDYKEVTSVTVIELNQDVIDLILPHLKKLPGSEKLNVIQGDMMEWNPPRGTKYDMMYFDIWPDICLDNYDDMRALHKKFGRRKKSKESFIDSWTYERLKYEARVQPNWR